MSIICSTPNSSLIDHRDFICNLYKSVRITAEDLRSFTLDSKLFSIKSIRRADSKKRRHNAADKYEEISTIKKRYESFLNKIPLEVKSEIFTKYNLLDTGAVRDLAKKLFESTAIDLGGINGGNNSEIPLQCTIKEEKFLIPQNSRFFCGCVKDHCQKLETKFDIVVADPPWWNKFIRRLKIANEKLSYKMMSNDDIASLPVKRLMSPNCLVAMWCTNSSSNITAVKDLIFPAWGVSYLTTWYWMKVTIDLEPLCPFGTGHKKQPYERVILGKVGQLKRDPESHLVISVPSALHSHKPPLLDLLTPYVETVDPQVLELFARYLLPNTTSVGFEPLKWQHVSLYETVS